MASEETASASTTTVRKRGGELKVNITHGETVTKQWSAAKGGNLCMDVIHTPEAKPWIGPKMVLNDYFSDYKEVIADSRVAGVRKGDFRDASLAKVKDLCEDGEKGAIPDDVFDEIVENCDPESFTLKSEVQPQSQFSNPKGDIPKYSMESIPSDGPKLLKTLAYQKLFIDKASNYQRFRRMRGLRNPNNTWFESAPPLPKKVSPEFTDKAIVATVRIYRPIKSSLRLQAASTTNATRYVQEFLVLGSNTLAQLRDKIKCPSDFSQPGEMSDNPPWKKEKPSDPLFKKPKTVNPLKPRLARDLYPSGFFFIEGTFYNDFRFKDSIDYSEVIRKWAAESKRQIGPFETAAMDGIAIADLTLRLGYPYVYVHQGDHEHLFSFVDVRLASVDDSQRANDYPMERAMGTIHSKMCMVCNVYVAKWVTKNNLRVSSVQFHEFFLDKYSNYLIYFSGTRRPVLFL